MYSPKYFTLKELVKSDTAEAKKIDNTPTWEVVENLLSLCEHILDPIRAAWGKPLKINSGFRCQELNNVIGGASPTSVHRYGMAADVWPIGYGNKFDEFVNFVITYLKINNIKFDQLLVEKNSSGQVWLHIGEYSTSGLQREQIKKLVVK